MYMKAIKLLFIAVCTAGLLSTPVIGAQKAPKPCCAATVEAQKNCTHKCCKRAAEQGKICKRCHKEEKKDAK